MPNHCKIIQHSRPSRPIGLVGKCSCDFCDHSFTLSALNFSTRLLVGLYVTSRVFAQEGSSIRSPLHFLALLPFLSHFRLFFPILTSFRPISFLSFVASGVAKCDPQSMESAEKLRIFRRRFGILTNKANISI